MSVESDSAYRIDLDVFRGPLDLLLYLVKREEVDVRDIPIARIAEQFKEYLEVIQMIDVERAGDFLVMSSTLMEIKSKMLLPRPAVGEGNGEGEELEDPRAELIHQLLQYRAVQTAAEELETRADQQRLRHARRSPKTSTSYQVTNNTRLEPVEVWDLLSAFGRLMRETLSTDARTEYEVVVDQTPLHVYMEQIVAHLAQAKAGTRVLFSSVFTRPYHRGRLVGLFLGVLELAKQRRIISHQSEPFGEIYLQLCQEESTPSE